VIFNYNRLHFCFSSLFNLCPPYDLPWLLKKTIVWTKQPRGAYELLNRASSFLASVDVDVTWQSGFLLTLPCPSYFTPKYAKRVVTLHPYLQFQLSHIGMEFPIAPSYLRLCPTRLCHCRHCLNSMKFRNSDGGQ